MLSSFSLVDAAAIAAALTVIAAINWYFFLAERASAVAVRASSGVLEVAITVNGGYQPATVRVPAGVPVRLIFDRQETNSCSEEIVFADFGVRRFLPAFQQTAIEITAESPGTYEFTCGMSMLRGTVVAE
jgi:plastocyanin domain-containing protein